MTAGDSDQILRLLDSTGALLEGHFRLSSGLHSNSYVQCARLLSVPRNADHIGRMLATRLGKLEADLVVAPALGGLVIGYTVAAALAVPMIFTERKDGVMTLRRGFSVPSGARCVIVEDVVTTGKSTRETHAIIDGLGGKVVGFGSILNRSGTANPFDDPYEFLLALDLETYPEESCPQCASGTPLDAPGSRFGESR